MEQVNDWGSLQRKHDDAETVISTLAQEVDVLLCNLGRNLTPLEDSSVLDIGTHELYDISHGLDSLRELVKALPECTRIAMAPIGIKRLLRRGRDDQALADYLRLRDTLPPGQSFAPVRRELMDLQKALSERICAQLIEALIGGTTAGLLAASLLKIVPPTTALILLLISCSSHNAAHPDLSYKAKELVLDTTLSESSTMAGPLHSDEHRAAIAHELEHVYKIYTLDITSSHTV